MKELVTYCMSCNKEVFCNGGFFNGFVNDDKTIICFDCIKTDESNQSE